MNYGTPKVDECYYCKGTGLTEEVKFCPNCGFPHAGTEYEMNEFIRIANHRLSILKDQKTNIGQAEKILYALAVIFGLFGLFSGVVINFNLDLLITNLIVAAIYLGLAIWCNKNPFAAILTGFLLYITLQVLNALIDPTTIYQGLLLKIFLISGLYYGYNAVKKAQKIEKELKSIEIGKDLSSNVNL